MGARRRGRVALRLDEEDLVLPFAIDLRVWQEWAVKLCEGFSLFLVCMLAQGLALAPIYIILCHLSISLYYWCNNWRTSTSNLNLKLEATLNWPSHPHIPTQRSIVLEDPPSKAACPCFATMDQSSVGVIRNGGVIIVHTCMTVARLMYQKWHHQDITVHYCTLMSLHNIEPICK